MAQPVWVLSVDLQAKSATFISGMGDAAKGARSSFQDIKSGANDMARGTNYSMMEARHGVMLLGEEFGFHLPRAITSFIASLGPVGAAMEAAFPFLAILVGATLLLEHFHKLKEEGEKLTEAQAAFGATVTRVLNDLDDKLIQAGIRTDELNHNHLAALNKQLELLDHQSLNELVRSFDTLEKAADKTFVALKTHWFSLSAGSSGAAHALKEFKAQYDELLAKGKEADASNLLKGTLDQARAFLTEMEAAKGVFGADDPKERQAQQDLVEILEAQTRAQAKLNQIKAEEKGNLVQAYNDSQVINLIGRVDRIAALHKKEAAEDEKLAEEKIHLEESVTRYFAEEWAKRQKLQEEAGMAEAGHGEKMRGLKIAAEREHDQVALSAMRNSAAARVEEEVKIANEELENHQKANADRIAALDKGGKDYENKLRQLQNKQLELIQEHENKVTAIRDKAEEDRNRRLLAADTRMNDAVAKGLTDTLMRHETFSKMLISLGDQVVAGMLQNAIKTILANDMTKPSDAAYAARQGWKAGSKFPFPTDLVMAPLLAAAAFTSVMAFEGGGLVPGVGKGDIMPAMLEPGETVLTKRLTEGLTNAAQGGGGNVTHVHATFNAHVQALDQEGVDRVLRDHADTFHRHFQNHVRKMNR